MNFKFRIIFVFLFVFSANESLFSQVSISKSEVDYSLKIEKDSVHRILTFWKDKDSSIYSSVKYSISDFNNISSEKKLIDEINTLNLLWDIAKDSIALNLNSFNIGYPLLYSDVLKNHIQAFIDSEDWQNHIKQNGKNLNYEIIRKVMIEANAYKPLNKFLKTKNYYISGFETEKHGFVTKENLQKAGFSGSEIIPMPFIIWAILEKNK
jgi:hypothetical protein